MNARKLSLASFIMERGGISHPPCDHRSPVVGIRLAHHFSGTCEPMAMSRVEHLHPNSEIFCPQRFLEHLHAGDGHLALGTVFSRLVERVPNNRSGSSFLRRVYRPLRNAWGCNAHNHPCGWSSPEQSRQLKSNRRS